MRRILVLRGGALGDLIVTLPALNLLRQRWPLARIELVGNSEAGAIPVAAGLVNQVHSQHEARWAALYGNNALSPEFARWLGDFDLVLNTWPDPDHELRTRFPVHLGQTFLSADSQPKRAPAAMHYCALLRWPDLQPAAPWYDLSNLFPSSSGADSRGEKPPESAEAEVARPRASRVTRRMKIAIHIGSGSPKKNWPIERWGELARWLRNECGADVLVVTGPAETAAIPSDWGREIRTPSLLSLAAELRHCRLFLGHDSGISHLAAAVRLPSILLFGPTDPAMWAPPAPHVRVIQRGADLAGISLSEVQVAVRAALGDR